MLTNSICIVNTTDGGFAFKDGGTMLEDDGAGFNQFTSSTRANT